jgi:cytochrome c oxidase assembly protein subunit 11
MIVQKRSTTSRRRRNLIVVVPAVGLIGIMLGLVAYSPTLYRLFCAATGFGGTTQRARSAPSEVSHRRITVRFDSNVASGLPWRFAPVQREVNVSLGQQQLAFFTAENLSDKAIVAHAVFNVTPPTSGIYFNKIQCFCFDEERLDAHQKVDMPVVFFVAPELASDPEMDDLNTITLSYTFFRVANPENAKDLSRFVTAPGEPNAGRGQQFFAERCTACHALDVNKAGPMLGGIYGRKAGSSPGYAYSVALTGSGLRWTGDTLDRWLSDPSKAVPGVRMPVRVSDASVRRDIIAYLKEETSQSTTRDETNLKTKSPAGRL